MSSEELTCPGGANVSGQIKPFFFQSLQYILTSLPSSSSLSTLSSSSSSICYLKINDAQGSGLDLFLTHTEKSQYFSLSSHLGADGPQMCSSLPRPHDLSSTLKHAALTSTQTMANSHLLHGRKSNTPLSGPILSLPDNPCWLSY